MGRVAETGEIAPAIAWLLGPEGQVAGLRGPNRSAYNAFLRDLARRGCEAMGYRVTGDLRDQLCVKHFRGPRRPVVPFADPETAWIVLVGQPLDDDPNNIHVLLYRVLGTFLDACDQRP